MKENNYDLHEVLQDYVETSPDKEIRIINAAINIFSEKGFEATRTKEIAARAGVAEGTIFRYFPTKTAILESLVPLLIRVMLPKIKKPIDQILADYGDEPAENILRAIMLDRIQMIRQNERFIKSVLPELIHRVPLQNQFRSSILPVIEQYVGKVLANGKERGELAESLDPHMAMLQLLGFILTFSMFGYENEADDAAEVTRFLEFTLKGWNNKCK